MNPTLQKILNALEKADTMPAKEKERLRKELEKIEKTSHEKDALLISQARELEIEAALERVRAMTMTMQSSKELAMVNTLVVNQINLLINSLYAVGIHICHSEKPMSDAWIGDPVEGQMPYLEFDHSKDPLSIRIYREWKNGNSFHFETLEGKDLIVHFRFMATQIPNRGTFDPTSYPSKLTFHLANFSTGFLVFVTTEECPQEHYIFKRFAKVFEQTYTRFLDLKKAEAQAREAQIEGALERVRTRTMAMHKSEELAETALVLYEQFSLLGNIPDRMSIGIFKEDSRKLELWPTDQSGSKLNKKFAGSWERSPIMIKIYKAWKAKENSLVADLSGQDLKEWLKFIREEVKLFVDDSHIKGRRVQQAAFFSHGFLLFTTNEPIADEIMQLLIRFAGVFSQTYTRFLDLQKAEAQARQAQIEAALERVRTRTMAMHNTDDIAATVTTFFNEIMGLGLGNTTRSGIGILSQSEKMELWTASVKNKSEVVLHAGLLDMTIHPLLQGVKKAWQAGDPHFTYELSGEDKLVYFRAINKAPEYPIKIDMKKLPETVYHYSFPFRDGSLFVFADEHLQDDIQDIFKRFTAVFGQTYTRYLDLHKAEAQARESQIQLSLERVRARSLAMQSSDELHEVLGVLFRQFDDLGIQPVNVFLSLFDRKERTLTYRASGKSGKRIPGKQVVEVDSMEALQALYDKWLTDNSDTVEVIFYPKEVLPQLFGVFAETFSSMPKGARIGVNDFPDGGYSMAGYTPFGYLGYDHQRQATEEEKNILSRFCVEFTRVYQRFLDIQKAEAQAREAKIEAALERVRASTMAMHKTEELSGVIKLFFQQFELLGLTIDTCILDIVKKGSNDLNAWIAAGTETYPRQVYVPFFEHPIFTELATARAKKEEFLVMALGKKSKTLFFDHFYKKATNIQVPKKRKDLIAKGLGINASWIILRHANIGLWNYRGIVYNDEENQILQRLGKVFEQTYTRFLDLQKAEAQTREAQIEAALEKVRSQSLAMHTTSEMQQVANAVFDQLRELGLEMDAVGMSGAISAKQDYDVWVGGVPFGKALRIPYNENTKVQRDYNKMLEERPELFAKTYSGKDKEEYINHLLTHGDFPKALKKKMKTSETFSTSIALAKKSSIQILRYTAQPYSEEDNEILKRFSKVFEQAYIRFMDLEKAEAQARESQIEAALEKVRSRSLAMQKPEELQEVVAVVGNKLQELGVILDSGGVVICTYFPDSKDVMHWTATFDAAHPSVPYYLPYFDTPIWKETWASKWESDDDFFEKIFSFKDKNHFFHKAFEISDYKNLPEEHKKEILSVKTHALSFAWQTNSALMIPSHTGKLLPEEHKIILKRFARVFEQAYIRFMDLEKAEIQARDAQIEAALEKVRSSMMAMHKTEELHLVLKTLFEQMQSLGLEVQGSAIIIYDENLAAEHWMIGFSGEFPKSYKIPYSEHSYFTDIVKAWQKGVPFQEFFFEGDLKVEYGKWALENSDFKHMPPEFKKEMLDPTRLVLSDVFNKYGMIEIMGPEPLPKVTVDILIRFSKVFEQSYTRFLDLKKAEAQAREAQIEVAMERVRSRAMAMHHTDELTDVLGVLFDQFDFLGINPVLTHLTLFDEENETFTLRITTGGEKRTIAEQLIDVNAVESWKTSFANWKKSDLHALDCIDYPPEVLPAVWEVLNEVMTALPEGQKIYPEDFPNGLYTTQGHCKYGYIGFNHSRRATEEEKEIVIRFAKEFGRLYQRFLDIQKAESQAREAQIEAALEKVRSASLAMHQSKDLHNVLVMLYNQLDALGLKMHSAQISESIEDPKAIHSWIVTNGVVYPEQVHAPFSKNIYFKRFREAVTNGESFYTLKLSKQQKDKHFHHIFDNSSLKNVPKERKDLIFSSPGLGTSNAMGKYTSLSIMRYDGILYSEEENEIIKRFAKVLEQSYTRFLDLQKAESQVREAKIEAALEKVRSCTMAMHKSQELHKVVLTVSQVIRNLGLNISATHIYRFEEGDKGINMWIAGDGGVYPYEVYFPYFKHQFFDGLYHARTTNKTFFTMSGTSKKEKNRLYRHLLNSSKIEISEDRKKYVLDAKSWAGIVALGKYSGIGVLRLTEEVEEEFSVEEYEILKRLSKVFEQAYIRFLDLQKAEAQAREAQIEAALEKVRSASLAMHQSKDLHDVLVMLYNQLASLGLKMHSAQIIESIDDFKEMHIWIVTNGVVYPEQVHAPFSKNIFFKRFREAVTNGESFYTTKFSKRQKDNLFHHFFDNTILRNAPQERKDLIFSSPGIGTSNAIGKYTALSIMRYDGILYSEEENEIIKRFLKVFEQSYTRFLDLQKAESQAREAQIEAALERVRSKAMAMHSSDDLADTVEILYKELDTLQVHALRFGHAKVNSDTKIVELHTATDLGKVVGQLKLEGHPLLEKIYEHFLAKEDLYYALQGEEMKSYYSILGRAIDVPIPPMDTVQHGYFFILGDTANYAWSDKALDEEELKVYRRLITVLNLTYKRYEELKNAETQAREAQIEGALERVRSKTMAMHNSEDLEEIVLSLFDEVLNLGIDNSIRCGIGILEGHEGMETRSVNSNSDGTVELRVGMLNMTIHPMLVNLKKAWKNGKKGYSYEYTAKDVRKYYKALNNEPEYPFNADLEALPEQEFHRSFFYSSGIIFAFSENPISEESSKVLARFAAVFGQTYRRFLDLQKAEERAKDAVKQASLDRVRGQIASMRSAEDLERITPLVWNELTTLGIPFIRCGVFIIEESNKTVQAFLSAPDGRSLGAMQIPFDAEKNTAETVAHWQKGEVYRTHWDKRQFLEFMQTMIDLGQVNNNKEYQGAEEPPESLHLHFVPFRQGMLYVGSEASLTVEQIELVQSLADAFAIAYARYEDFDKLEKAKERVETALSELKATQNQLVQSEKMASLGELTAGIAHEIQNPLNFVNNFSEVSVELIEEMLEEIQKGDVEEVKALAEDIIQNLEKINHHGKRADGIVKGMLQHSRASSGEKEPTDLNVLADEYLRLAYHGLRAKDKSFNAKLETHFDESIGKVSVMAQDIGRVILNLITNAFYVVQKKKEQHPEGYEPTVTVSTKKTKEGVIISVKDNGNGIPEGIKEKIFQPFFTTKPTGQGTGLGLSMSYDIITKGHGGELKVETKEGQGTTFLISLPFKTKNN